MNPTAECLSALLSARMPLDDSCVDDPVTVVAAAEAHGVSALLWHTAAAHDGRAAQRMRDVLAPGVRAAATRDVLVQRELQRVLAALAAGTVSTLVVKGAALAYTVYAEPWLRPRTDTDLLVRPDEACRAGRILEDCGYAPTDALSSGTLISHQRAFEHIDRHGLRHVIDLHWKAVNPQLLADVLPFDLLWPEARPAPALGPAARVPAPAASVVLACVHRLAHHQDLERLIWLYDLDLLGRAMDAADWHALQELAMSRRVAGLCQDGLLQAARWFGTDMPSAVMAAFAAAAPGEPSRRYLEGTVQKRHVLVSDLAVLSTWRARVRLLREHAFPPPAFVMSRYETHHRLLLPALYMHRLVTGAWKWLRA